MLICDVTCSFFSLVFWFTFDSWSHQQWSHELYHLSCLHHAFINGPHLFFYCVLSSWTPCYCSFFWAQHFQEWFCCCCWSFCFSQDGYNFKKSSPNSGAPGFLPVSFEVVFMKSVRSVSRISPLPLFAYTYPATISFFSMLSMSTKRNYLNFS